MKTLKMLFKNDKEKFVAPKGVQDTIPVQRIWDFSKSTLFNLRLDIVILVVAPQSKLFNSSEYSKNIASLSLRLATA